MPERQDQGFALVAVLMLVAMLTALLSAYFMMTRMELSTLKSSMNGTRGFYAAEAGLNLRADGIRAAFLGYSRPSGESPETVPGALPCLAGDPGSGDFRCILYEFGDREVLTYMTEAPDNPALIVIPPGEPYQNLNAQEYTFQAHSVAKSKWDERPEAILDMHFKSRLVPLFQFAAFYAKDLEILPGPEMTLEGPVHSNKDLYLGGFTRLTIDSQVTTAGTLYHGRKAANECMPGTARVYDPASPAPLPACGPGRIVLPESALDPWHGLIRVGVDPVTVPPPETIEPTPGQVYWDRADVRIVFDVHEDAVEVRNPDGTSDVVATTALRNCGAVRSALQVLKNHRENSKIDMLEVDVGDLLDCIHDRPAVAGGRLLDDATDGGLVWYLGVDGPDSSVQNNYGVRVRNGARLESAGAPEIRGLTIVTDQALYIQGDYNTSGWKPAAFLADTINVLSNSWLDANSASTSIDTRVASNTAIYAAFLAGTDTTGGFDGVAGQNSGDYNGGLENFPRFHEKWFGSKLTYRGSFVSLDRPRHARGRWSVPGHYSAPDRDWKYDTRFNDVDNLPPLTPRFVYMRQQLFVRQFEL